MTWNSPLNKIGKGQMSASKLKGKSKFHCNRTVEVPNSCKKNYLEDPESYDTRKRPDRPPKITNADRRQLFREASKGQSSSKNLQKPLNLHIAPRRVRQFLHKSQNIVYRKRKIAPALTAKHKNMRVDWVNKNNMDKGEIGNCSIF